MATRAPEGLDVAKLRSDVCEVYARVAVEPYGKFHFHRGADYARRLLGYSGPEFERLPTVSTDAFAGVGNPHRVAELQAGQVVLDVCCGAGTDLLIAAQKVGPSGKAIGVDLTQGMLERARQGAAELGLENVDLRHGDALELPVADASVDVVMSNGSLNLVHDKNRAYAEIARVLKPGGRLMLADIVVEEELPEGVRKDIDLWSG